MINLEIRRALGLAHGFNLFSKNTPKCSEGAEDGWVDKVNLSKISEDWASEGNVFGNYHGIELV